MRSAVLLLVLSLAGCGDATPERAPSRPQATQPDPALPSTGAEEAPATAARDSAVADRTVRPRQPAAGFDRSTVVFDTLEPLPPRVEIQPRPPPPPRPEPEPEPTPPIAQEPPKSSTVGSCDVRLTESFCFSYTGTGWSGRSARAHCRDAPESTFQAAACPTTDAIATCRFLRDDAPAREIVYTYYAPYALALAELACPGEFERIEAE